ncbi:aldo/keto reductase [Sorangium sp. So ce394]
MDLGINFFDTADVYSLGESESVLGRALKDLGPSRDRLVIATKVHCPMGDDPNQRGRFVAMQNHYNLVYREEEREVIPLCRSEGIGVIPWSPLARGFLVGNRSKDGKGETVRAKSDEFAQRLYFQDSDFAVVEKVTEIAAKRGVPNAQVALAWLLQQPGVTAPIIGATKLSHLNDTAKAVELELDADELRALAEPYRPHPVLGHT